MIFCGKRKTKRVKNENEIISDFSVPLRKSKESNLFSYFPISTSRKENLNRGKFPAKIICGALCRFINSEYGLGILFCPGQGKGVSGTASQAGWAALSIALPLRLIAELALPFFWS
ncbi:hypothetical protein CDAR_604621 [Caerostris darwini]|uniref:Uncharacterized protein n=1 Tax=Caerostris darwini TaxID=1538125 RepID=A0AAV4MTV4_9ARAC|nr:hypothetical protein CDAR_604621 [Caerostris darwini]